MLQGTQLGRSLLLQRQKDAASKQSLFVMRLLYSPSEQRYRTRRDGAFQKYESELQPT